MILSTCIALVVNVLWRISLAELLFLNNLRFYICLIARLAWCTYLSFGCFILNLSMHIMYTLRLNFLSVYQCIYVCIFRSVIIYIFEHKQLRWAFNDRMWLILATVCFISSSIHWSLFTYFRIFQYKFNTWYNFSITDVFTYFYDRSRQHNENAYFSH